jgi:threonine 3-dehydrogenase
MKGLAKLKSEPGIWQVDDAPVPEIGPNDVLIKIRKSAICGTDLHIYKWDEWAAKTIPVPMIVGHEYVGTIEKLGSEVTHLKKGQRVSGEGHIVCGHCRNCRAGQRHLCPNTKGVGVNRQGSFAEFLSLPAVNIFPVPDDISDEMAAIFDPFGNAVHTALSFDLVGEDVVITGAGPIGCMAIPICKHAGARHVVITDVNPYRLNLAKEMGAAYAMDATKETLKDVMKKLDMSEGFDVGLEMSGIESAFKGMISTMRNGGKIALLGIPPGGKMDIDWNQVIFKGLIVKGIYGREMFETWYKMTSMLQSGLDISKVITHRLQIGQFQEGFEIMKSGQCGKVILEWPD